MTTKKIGVLILVWIGTVVIAFLAGYLPQHSQLRHDEAKIANFNSEMRLARLQILAGTLYLQTNERNYGLAATTSSQFFDQLRSSVELVGDPRLKQTLAELSKNEDQITAGLANGDPGVLPKVADLLRNTPSTL
jgi:hypothetical protein